MKNILVAVDFKNNPRKLLKNAAQLAIKFNSKIWIVHVAAPDPDFIGYKAGPPYIIDQRVKELRKEHKAIQKYANDLSKKGISATGLLVQGSTVQTLLYEVKRLKIDLIIIGMHEHNILYRALNEVTTSAVIRKAKIPMLIVPLD